MLKTGHEFEFWVTSEYPPSLVCSSSTLGSIPCVLVDCSSCSEFMTGTKTVLSHANRHTLSHHLLKTLLFLHAVSLLISSVYLLLPQDYSSITTVQMKFGFFLQGVKWLS
jgi:hypothetical protein